MPLHESGEMYLETIYVLTREKPAVRAIDVGEHMGFSKPSISRALSLLKKDGYVTADENGYLALTESGRDVAEKIYRRHTMLIQFLTAIGVDQATATADACKIEHAISDGTFVAMKRYLDEHLSGK